MGSKDDDMGMSSRREQKLDNPHNRKGKSRGGRRAKREANRGTARNKYEGMGAGDKEKRKSADSEGRFDDSQLEKVHIYWKYGEVRLFDIADCEEGYARGEIENLYPQVKDVSDFCRINKGEERYHLVSGGLERHYVHVEKGGVVGAVMAENMRVSNGDLLEELIPGVRAYDSRRDKV